MKKVFILIVALIMILGIIGCSAENIYEKAFTAFESEDYENAYKYSKTYLKKNEDEKMREVLISSSLRKIYDYYAIHGDQGLYEPPFIMVRDNGDYQVKAYFLEDQLCMVVNKTDSDAILNNVWVETNVYADEEKNDFVYFFCSGEEAYSIIKGKYDRLKYTKKNGFDDAVTVNGESVIQAIVNDYGIMASVDPNDYLLTTALYSAMLSNNREVLERIEKDTSVSPEDFGFINYSAITE